MIRHCHAAHAKSALRLSDPRATVMFESRVEGEEVYRERSRFPLVRGQPGRFGATVRRAPAA